MTNDLSHRTYRKLSGIRFRGRRCETPAGSGGPISRRPKEHGDAAGEMNQPLVLRIPFGVFPNRTPVRRTGFPSR